MSSNVDSISAMNGMNFMNPYMYADYDDMDLNFGVYPTIGSGSIFGGGYAMPMMGTGGTGSMQDIYNNMREQQQFMTDYNVDQQKQNRNADLRVNAPLEAIKGKAAILKDKITNGEQDQVMDAYQDFVNAVGTAYGSADANEIKARANSLYANMNGGVTLIQDLREYGHGSATQGFIQSVTLGAYGRRSAEDNISEITGAPVGTSEKTSQNLGRLAGIATIGTVAGGIAKACKSGKAGVIGLVAAGVAAAMTFITGKIST